MLRILVVLLAALALQCAVSQLGDEQQHTVQLTREMVDALLQVLSPNCRTEMEGALSSQMEISDECKYEIQRTLSAFQNSQGDAQSTDQPAQTKPASQDTTSATKSAAIGGVSPAVYIFGFVSAAVAAVGALVVYVNGHRSAIPASKTKKLSKKKVW
jgi:hypothetical protein